MNLDIIIYGDFNIILNWKSNKKQTLPLNQEKVVNRMSTSPRKTPLTGSDDFFYGKKGP